MRGRPLLSLLLLAALAGALLAGVLALTLPGAGRGEGAGGGADARDGGTLLAAQPPADAGDPARPSIGRPRADVRGWRQGWMKAVGPVRVEARAADPRGGPPWAVRVFHAQQLVERRDGSLKPTGRGQWCAQLGRELDGRFGWIDAANRFRPAVGIVFRSNPIRCAALRDDLGRQPQIELLTRVSDVAAGAPRPLQSVAWGFAGAAVSSVRLTIDGRSVPVPTTAHGVVLQPLPARERRSQLQAIVRYPRGGPILVDDSYAGAGSGIASSLRELERVDAGGRGRTHLAPVPLRRPGETPVLEYRVTDPTTGQPQGMVVARTRNGRWCASELAQVVGPRVGEIDRGLGTFRDARPSYGNTCGTAGARPTRARPLALGWTLGAAMAGVPPQAGSERRWRVERRTLPSTTRIYGAAHADVVSITIATPRDVRTITPSPRAHVFAVIYDGGFPTGEIVISARMRDGTIHRERPIGGP